MKTLHKNYFKAAGQAILATVLTLSAIGCDGKAEAPRKIEKDPYSKVEEIAKNRLLTIKDQNGSSNFDTMLDNGTVVSVNVYPVPLNSRLAAKGLYEVYEVSCDCENKKACRPVIITAKIFTCAR